MIVCMYVCLYVCMYVCMYVCKYNIPVTKQMLESSDAFQEVSLDSTSFDFWRKLSILASVTCKSASILFKRLGVKCGGVERVECGKGTDNRHLGKSQKIMALTDSSLVPLLLGLSGSGELELQESAVLESSSSFTAEESSWVVLARVREECFALGLRLGGLPLLAMAEGTSRACQQCTVQRTYMLTLYLM